MPESAEAVRNAFDAIENRVANAIEALERRAGQ